MTRAAMLQAYLDGFAGQPVVWGVSDCCMFAGRWAEQALGRPLDLPRYGSEVEGRALIAGAGGLLALWSDRADRADLVESFAPGIGDVGLVETSRGPVGCIVCSGGIVAVRADIGIGLLRPRHFLRIWTV